MTAKERYRLFCETETADTQVPLFLQYWWMDTVCQGKTWDVLLVDTTSNPSQTTATITAALPYLLGERLGMRFIIQPQLTQYNGPYYNYPAHLDEQHRLAFEQQVCAQLIKQLESLHLAYFEQNFAPTITNWLPFYWAGFHQTTRYTYRINDISDPQRVLASFDKHRRQRHILRAEKELTPTLDISPALFADFHQHYWHDRGQRDLLSPDFIVNVCTRALERRQGVLLGLRDTQGTLQAARFVVWDSRCAYSLLSALRPNHHNGASALLVWHLIQYLHDKTQAYDFEGSMDPNIEYSYRLYGTTQTPYFNISRCNNPLFRLLLTAKRWQE